MTSFAYPLFSPLDSAVPQRYRTLRPLPSGDLHLGNLRTAILAWAWLAAVANPSICAWRI